MQQVLKAKMEGQVEVVALAAPLAPTEEERTCLALTGRTGPVLLV